MGIHVSSGSGERFDFPIKLRRLYPKSNTEFIPGIYEDCTNRDKTGVPGPLTRAQFVELLWRVKEITFKCQITFTHKEETGDGEPEDLQTKTVSLETRLKRLNNVGKYDYDGKLPDENDIFRELFQGDDASRSYQTQWFGETNPNGDNGFDNGDSSGGMVINPFGYALQKDKDDGFWLHDRGEFVSSGLPPYFYCFARGVFQFPSLINPGFPNYVEFGIHSGKYTDPKVRDEEDYLNLDGNLNLQGKGVNFPLVVNAVTLTSFAILNITSATGSIEITEWFEYATTTGKPAWDKTTGRPINGGPSA